MVDQARARRLAKRISQIVASALEHEVKDPRLTMVTITDTRVTGDLRDATVYYTVLGRSVDDVPDTAGAAAALASATGVLRSKVGAGTGVRFTPTLTFVQDVVSGSNSLGVLCMRIDAITHVAASILPEGGPFGVDIDLDAQHLASTVKGGTLTTAVTTSIDPRSESGGFLAGATTVRPVAIGPIAPSIHLRNWMLSFFDPRAIPDSPDVSVVYSNPDSGATAPFGNFASCFLTRATLLNPLGSVRTTGRVPSTIELVVQPTSKQ